jgi:poly-gamma-glutamate synthesis protein (capsule biosynthesis protein)
MKRALAVALALLLCCTACRAKLAVTPFHEITPIPATPEATVAAALAPAASAGSSPSPTPAATPSPVTATLGFVGDIMAMNVQIANAKTAGGYDFSRSFAPMAAAFSSVDFLCGNFECTLAGEEAGYSLPRQTAPPATEANPTPKAPLQKFNAPDELARDLKNAGFDLLACANNHCMDKGIEGLYRTARVIRAAGMVQVGTYLDPADAASARVADINGIRVGFVSATNLINSGVPSLSAEERTYAVARLSDMDMIAAQIAACRAAEAEFVVAFVHWGEEHSSAQNKTQEALADALIAAGADAIVVTHPHVVQPIEWRTGERDGKTVRVPVIYSLGNFISNMAQKNVNYGAFVSLTLTKSAAGEVTCTALAYLPLLCYRDEVHTVKPCFFDETDESQKAFAHVRAVCATDGISLITRRDLLDHAGETSVDQSAQ